MYIITMLLLLLPINEHYVNITMLSLSLLILLLSL